MSERNGFEHGVPCWVAGVHPDPAEAASFYGDLLGWEPEEMEPGRLVCRLRGREVAAIGSGPHAAPEAAVWQTHVWVDDADAAAEQVSQSPSTSAAAGARPSSPTRQARRSRSGSRARCGARVSSTSRAPGR